MQTDILDATRAAAVSAARPPAAAGFDAQHLLESVVTDLHFSALQIGLIAILLAKCTREPGEWTMYPWRNVCQSDAPTMLLGLKYREQIAVRSSTADAIGKLYRDRDLHARRSHSLFSIRRAYDGEERAALAELGVGWCALSADAMRALSLLAEDTVGRLGPHYAGNDRIIDGVLKEAVSRDTSRVSLTGVIELPALTQRRRQPRINVNKPCRIAFAGREFDAMLLDVTRTGAGIVCRHRLAVDQSLTLLLPDGSRTTAKVVWRREDRYGLQLAGVLPT